MIPGKGEVQSERGKKTFMLQSYVNVMQKEKGEVCITSNSKVQ
jgi:hypothetical protein